MTGKLSKRQAEVIQLIAAEGLSCKEVAYRLGISFRTVEIHTARAVEALGAKNRMHAAVLWDRTRREEEAAAGRHQAEEALARERDGLDFCPTCWGNGFVRKAA